MNQDLSFTQLKKNLKKDFSSLPVLKIALLGDTPTQLLNQAIRGYGYLLGWNIEIWEADFDQIDRQILDPESELYKQSFDFILLFPSAQKLLTKFYKTKKEKKAVFVQSHTAYLQLLINTLFDGAHCKILFMNYAPYDDGVFGSFAAKTRLSFTSNLRAINVALDNLSAEKKDLFIIDVNALQSKAGSKASVSSTVYINNGFVFHLDFLPRIALEICQVIGAVNGKFHKCLIFDLDNTIWGGIVGDDGWQNLQIGDLGIGKAFTQMQLWARQLSMRGIILCICSKNNEDNAKQVFELHPDMILQLSDIAVFVANWETKVQNIHHIQSVLNIGFDSMVFIDDNPFERNMVRAALPQICVPEMPAEPEEYLPFLESLHLFETASISEEDENRTRLYQEEAKRSTLQTAFANEDEFLQSLEMKVEISSFTKYNIPRVAQLTQRSNQFNLRTIRYTEIDIEKISINENYISMAFSLEDIYGDYGLISTVILKKEKENLFIDTWIMSCRVLKRGMEQFVTEQIVAQAKKAGIEKIIGEYLPTQKNGIVKNLLSEMQFVYKENCWQLTVSEFTGIKNYIRLKEKNPQAENG